MSEEDRNKNKRYVHTKSNMHYSFWRKREKKKSVVEVNNNWKESNTFRFTVQHKYNKREIEPEADLANVVYELSSNGKKTSLTTKLPEKVVFFFF